MTAPHTSDLDHALAEALHIADSVRFVVTKRAEDGTPLIYGVTAWHGEQRFYTYDQSPTAALARSMRLLKGTVDGSLQVVDFATIRSEDGTS